MPKMSRERMQEHSDFVQLSKWKRWLDGKQGGEYCPPPVAEYLDENMPGWREHVEKELKKAANA